MARIHFNRQFNCRLFCSQRWNRLVFQRGHDRQSGSNSQRIAFATSRRQNIIGGCYLIDANLYETYNWYKSYGG